MNNYLMQRTDDVLLVVGDSDNLHQIRLSLQQARFKSRLHHVGDAVEARAYIRRDGPYMDAPTPGLVLLDASLPQESVIDLIAELKADARFPAIPVVVLVGSESEHRRIANSLHGLGCIAQKPFSLYELARIQLPVDTLSFLLLPSTPVE